MSALAVLQNVTAISPGLQSYFAASGGTAPYVFSVRSGGAGGSINASSGLYTAPATMSENPATISDTIQVRDSLGSIATGTILVGNALLLFCDIIQNQLSLPPGRVYLWDQKIFQPTDDGLYIAVYVLTCKPFGNNISFDGFASSGLEANQVVNMLATLQIDAISRGPSARDRKEEILLALNSVYAEQQQEINSFLIGRLPAGARFINLSQIDGAAIPYRFQISMNIQYAVTKQLSVPYYDTFQDVSVVTDA